MSAPLDLTHKYFRVVEPHAPSPPDLLWDGTAYAHAAKLMKRAVAVGDCLEYRNEWKMRFAGWSMRAHRVAWKLAHRDITSQALATLYLTQTCGNKLCVNVAHLQPVSKSAHGMGVAAAAAAVAAADPSFKDLPLSVQRDIEATRDADLARQKSDDRILAMFAQAEAFHRQQEATGPTPPTEEELARIAMRKERKAIQDKKTNDHIKQIVAEQRAKDAAKAAAARGPK